MLSQKNQFIEIKIFKLFLTYNYFFKVPDCLLMADEPRKKHKRHPIHKTLDSNQPSPKPLGSSHPTHKAPVGRSMAGHSISQPAASQVRRDLRQESRLLHCWPICCTLGVSSHYSLTDLYFTIIQLAIPQFSPHLVEGCPTLNNCSVGTPEL